jgi:hypothetical protein
MSLASERVVNIPLASGGGNGGFPKAVFSSVLQYTELRFRLRMVCASQTMLATNKHCTVHRFDVPMDETLLYTSKRTLRSLWQRYCIHRDRVELQSWILFHTLVVPAKEIRAVEVRPSVFSGRKGFVWGIKIDNSDLCRHVLLERRSGLFKRIAFSPDDPEKFVEVCKSIMAGG